MYTLRLRVIALTGRAHCQRQVAFFILSWGVITLGDMLFLPSTEKLTNTAFHSGQIKNK